jgi:hypothetical protein
MMMVRCTRSNDIRRTTVVRYQYIKWWLENRVLLYHRLAANCTSVERDLHSPNASGRGTGYSSMPTELVICE